MATDTRIEQIRALCAQHAQYEAGSAYTRTKILCDVLTKLGMPIPSWMVLREHIGKGSSGDINRGVKDFRSEHAELLQRMDGLPEGIPGRLAQPMRLLWQTALDEATAFALADARQDQIKVKLEKQSGKKLVLSFAVDPSIIGGVVLKVGDKVLDASLRAQLEILKEQIKRGE